jgi:Cys-rich repeat protein
MHRIKLILLILAIVVLSTTSFKCIAQAAEVTRINKNRGLIVINGNKDDGFVMGASVCFYSTSGEEITCGKVQQTSDSYVTVKVNNRKAKQIRNGMEAQLEDKEKGQEYIGSTKEEQGCVDDSDCGAGEYCVTGKCIGGKQEQGCVDDSGCGDGGYCINGERQ